MMDPLEHMESAAESRYYRDHADDKFTCRICGKRTPLESGLSESPNPYVFPSLCMDCGYETPRTPNPEESDG